MLTLKQIDGRIARLSGRYLKINEDVQEIAVSIVSHANDTGDCSRAVRLVRAVPPKMRALLTGWFTEVSPINVRVGKTVKDDKVSLRKEGKRNYNPFDIDKARANLWYEDPFKVAPEPTLATLATFMDKVDRLFDKMERDTKPDAGKVAEDAVEDIRALRSHLRTAYVEFINGNGIERDVEETANDDDAGEENLPAGVREAVNG